MKRIFGVLLASTLILGACGNKDGNNDDKTETVNENKTQFKNDTLVIDDAVVKIKDTFIVNDKNSDSKLLAFKYEVKNKTDKDEITPMNVWIATMQAQQDSENTVNDLEVGPTPNTGKFEEWDKHSQDTVKKGKSAKGITTYSLQNDEDVTLKATKGVDGKELGAKKIKLDDLKTVDYDAAADMTNESNDNNNGEYETASQSNEDSISNSTSAKNVVSNNKVKQESNQSPSTNSKATQEQDSSSENGTSNDYMSDAEIAEWNKSKPTTHDESQMQGVGGHPSAFDPSIPKETQGVPKTDSNGEQFIDATGE